MKFPITPPLSAIITGLLCMPITSHAYLGGFEPEDGYQSFLNEVTQYNAGQYGSNNGGSSATLTALIPPGSGLWHRLIGIDYPQASQFGSTSYATGHPFFDHTNHGTVDQALVFTTNSEGWDGPTLKYAYDLDSRDLDGLSPLDTAGKTIDISFWWCPQIWGTGEGGGLPAGTFGDRIELLGSNGVGFTMGLVQPGTTTDFVGYDTGSGFIQTAIQGYNLGYSQWQLSLNLLTNTISASYLDGATGSIYNLLDKATLSVPMGNFVGLSFESTPGINNAKLLSVDDFEFSVAKVPEPNTIWLLSVALFLFCGIPQLKKQLVQK